MLNIKNDDIIKISRKKGKKNDRIFFCQIELHTSFFCLKIQKKTKICKRLKKNTLPPLRELFSCSTYYQYMSVYTDIPFPRSQSVQSVASCSYTQGIHSPE